MRLHHIKQGALLLFLGLFFPLLAPAQEISSLSPSSLPFGGYITGLYNIEADNGSGLYLKEQPDGSLTTATLNAADSGFYFWLVENVYADYFQLYSASRQEEFIQINADGSIQWTTDTTAENSKLLFRMYSEGPQRTAADAAAGITATGYITTGALSAGYGNTDCQCNFLTVNGNARFRLYNSGIGNISNYRPVVFEKTEDANTLGTATIDTVNQLTRISQAPPPVGPALPHNFVSSNFFVRGFGPDDFKVTVDSTTNGYIGFLDYTNHQYTKDVYKAARSKIGLKIVDGAVSLVYLSGDQLLPNGSLEREVATGFVADSVFTLGFKGQDSLVVSQGGLTHVLERTAPAELFFNRSVTQNARMLVSLVEGQVELSYTPKNYLINSEDDLGKDDGSELVSTHAFFPYNGGDPLVNTFDWEQTKWKVYYQGSSGPVKDTVFSPFYSDNTEFSAISARFDLSGNYQGGEDFASTEGWELIKANLGYNANGTEQNQAPAHPYVMFYDRIGGTLRVFVYIDNPTMANHLKVSLVALGGTPPFGQGGYVPKLWGSLQQFASLDQVKKGTYTKTSSLYSSTARSWYFTDFVMEYDPCIAFFESTIELWLEKETIGSLTMVGRFEGGTLPANTPEYNAWQVQQQDFLTGVMDTDFGSLANTLGDITFNQYEQFDLLDFKNTVDGVLVGKQIADWEKEKARIEWEATQTIADATIVEGSFKVGEGALQIVEGVATASDLKIPILSVVSSGSAGVAKIGQGYTKIGQGSAKIVAGKAKARLAGAKKLYYDNIKDKVKHSDQNISMEVPPPRPQLVFGELALQGTLTIKTGLQPNEFVATPGGLNSDNAPEWYVSNSRGARPLYNRPLGKFTLLKQPEFAIGVAKSANSGYKAWLKIKKKPYFAYNNTAIGKINDILTISISVETLDEEGRSVRTSTGEGGYTTLFGTQNNPLPAAMEISGLVDWNQINTNSAGLTAQQIEGQLSNWIQVSYEVWSITPTTLKSRDLKRVYANGDQYYDGVSTFNYAESNTPYYEVLQEAKVLADGIPGYDFSDDANFGNTYHLFHTQYDTAGDAFYAVMQTYCNNLNNVQNPAPKNAEEAQDIKGKETAEEEPIAEELTVLEPGLTVYPNPARYEVNFRLVSEEKGHAGITLYDLTGRALISTTDILNGRDVLQGQITIAPLPAGIYILEVQLPGGKAITKKIVKQ